MSEYHGGPARIYHANGLPQEDRCRSLSSGKKSYREEGFITIKITSRMVKKAGLNKARLNYGLTLRTIISHGCPGDPFFQVATCVSCHRMNEAGNEFGPDLTKLDPKQAPGRPAP